MITINIDKARLIAHDKRRLKRAEEFSPLDEVIAKQIPGTDVAAVEAQRQAIRDRHAAIQTDIDAAASVDALKTIVDGLA